MAFFKGNRKRTLLNEHQFGDGGKGHIIDYLAEEVDIVIRYSGGANAGHTIITPNGAKFVAHLVPSGILYPKVFNFIAAPVLVNVSSLTQEIKNFQDQGISITKDNFGISEACHVTLEYHIDEERAKENAAGKNKIGSTLKGIGPTARDKADRSGIRLVDLVNGDFSRLEKKLNSLNLKDPKIELTISAYKEAYQEAISILGQYLAHDADIMHRFRNGKWLLEGAQGHYLDNDFGTYPFVTSTPTNFPKARYDTMISVVKAYSTRVGGGPYIAKIQEQEIEEFIRKVGKEFGATTGRPRDCGWFDAVMARTACMLEEPDYLAVTKLDVLSGVETIKVVNFYDTPTFRWNLVPNHLKDLQESKPVYLEFPGWEADISEVKEFKNLPGNAQKYVKAIEELAGAPVGFVSIGARRDQIIDLTK